MADTMVTVFMMKQCGYSVDLCIVSAVFYWWLVEMNLQHTDVALMCALFLSYFIGSLWHGTCVFKLQTF